MLLHLVPEEPTPGLLASAELLALSTTTLEAQWKAQAVPRRTEDARPADVRLDRIWVVVEQGLTRYTIFDADDPDRLSAAEIHGRLFPSGLQFIRLPFLEQHAESQRRVDLIEEEDLRDELDRLVGEVFLDELLAAHEAYGEVLGITKAGKAITPAVSIIEPLRELADAMSAYAIQLLAFAGADREKNTAAVRLALAPFDEFRRAAARRSNAAAGSSGPASGTGATEPELDDLELPEGAPAPDSPMPTLPTR